MARISKINVNNTEYDLGNQVSSMPTASADELGKVYQYIGSTDSTYTHGYFYECKAGSTSGTYVWENVSVGQGSSGGVTSFNGRAGAVTPQNGDYTAAQVGAVAASGGDAVDAITSEISIPLWGYVKESGSSLISGISATSYYDGADIATETHVMQVAKYVGSSPVIGETFATVSNNVITLKTYWDGGAEETVTLSNHLFVNLFSGTVYMMLADRNVISDNIILNPDPTEFIPESISAIKYKTFRNVLGHMNNFLSYLKKGKADKVSPVTSGDVATLDSYGNIVDSGKTLGISVPTPAAGDENKVFSGAGIWVPQSGGAAISSIGSDESGRTTSSRAYAQGEHFYKDGKFCEAKTAIASGATLTLNTNYTESTISDVITTLNSQLVNESVFDDYQNFTKIQPSGSRFSTDTEVGGYKVVGKYVYIYAIIYPDKSKFGAGYNYWQVSTASLPLPILPSVPLNLLDQRSNQSCAFTFAEIRPSGNYAYLALQGTAQNLLSDVFVVVKGVYRTT